MILFEPILLKAKRRIIKYFNGIIGCKNFGYCPICEKKTLFVEFGPWLRDKYQCVRCHSIPRQRALVVALDTFYPNWRSLIIHESSPSKLMAAFFKEECSNYSISFFFLDTPLGEEVNGIKCEDISKLTFSDNSVDLFVTQDVFEHVMDPFVAFKEISRVLKPGGAHIFTTPWYKNLEKSRARVRLVDGTLQYLEPPIYHGNPIDSNGSLVTYDYGLDFVDLIYLESGLVTTVFLEYNRKKGLDAELLEVFISRKL